MGGGAVVVRCPFNEVVCDVESCCIWCRVFKIDDNDLQAEIRTSRGGISTEKKTTNLAMLVESLAVILEPQNITILCIVVRKYSSRAKGAWSAQEPR